VVGEEISGFVSMRPGRFSAKRTICFNELANSIEIKPSRSSLAPFTGFKLID